MQPPVSSAAVALGCLVLTAAAACVNRSASGELERNAAETGVLNALEGQWSLTDRSPAGIRHRLMVEIRVDSVRSPRVYGGLTHFFTGDVGLDPARFDQFDGAVTADSFVAFTISTSENPPALFSIAGTLVPDTIRVTRFILGPDTLSGRDRAWLLVRKAGGS